MLIIVCLGYTRLSWENYQLGFSISGWNCILQLYIESVTAFSDIDEEIARISGFCWSAEKESHRLARPRNVSTDLKYDVLCL